MALLILAAWLATDVPGAAQTPLSPADLAGAEKLPLLPEPPKADPPKADAKPEAETKPKDKADDLKMTATWKDGLYIESANKKFRVNVGGRTQFDTVWMVAPQNVQFGAGGVGRLDDAVNFRRARLDMDGTLFGNIDFYTQIDFINSFVVDRNAAGIARPANTPAPTDLWMTFRELPWVGNLRVGNQKAPVAFEHMTSSRYLNFLERSMGFDAFVEDQDNGFMPGICIYDTALDERMTWAVGLFKHTRNVFGWNTGDGEGDVTGRITILPVYRSDGRYLVHLGLGASHSDLDDHLERYRARTMLRNGPAVLHTILAEANMVGRNRQLLVPEFVAVWGPWSLEAEYYLAWVNGAEIPVAQPRVLQGTVFFHAFTVEMHYFLTGEHRAYSRKTASFGRVVPNRKASWGKEALESPGRGAWQLAARYQFIDLNDKGVTGGIIHESTCGVNWFLNANMKVQWNYSLAYRDAVGVAADGFIHGFGTRLAWDF